MLISQTDLEILEDEWTKLLNTTIFSNKLAEICVKVTKRILHTKAYITYPTEWKELAETDAIIKILKTLPKYNNTKAQESRTLHRQEENVGKGMYRFLVLVATSGIYSSIAKSIKFQNINKSIPHHFFYMDE